MRTAIDRAGRVVVPKPIRDALGLEPGSPLEVELRDGAIVLEPPTTPMRLVRRGAGVVAEPGVPLPELTAQQVRGALDAVRR